MHTTAYLNPGYTGCEIALFVRNMQASLIADVVVIVYFEGVFYGFEDIRQYVTMPTFHARQGRFSVNK